MSLLSPPGTPAHQPPTRVLRSGRRLPSRRILTSGIAAALAGLLTASIAPGLPVQAAATAGAPKPSPRAAVAATAPSPALAHTYAASSAVIANPDRGLFHYTETHRRVDGSGYTPLDVATAVRWRTQEGVTLVYRIFYLEGFVDTDRLDPKYLGQVRSDLLAARAAGVKLVVRFAYSADSSRDAPAARVVKHIRQLAPVLNANADVIATLQAGFVGRWGEWYYSDSFASDASRPWALTDADWQRRGSVLRALLTATNPSIFVQVRYPGIKQRLLRGQPRATGARVSIHNDCFLAGSDDYGTFATEGDRAWLAAETRRVPLGGETCAVNTPRSQWPSASAELAAYHWSYLNADYQPEVLRSWGTAGLNQVRLRLGYRIRLTRVTLPARAVAAAPFAVRVHLVNTGYAAPFRARPVRLVLKGAAGETVSEVPLDVRMLAPGRATSVAFTVRAPARPGRYAVYLALPDPSPRLATDPAYAVQLANVNTWDPATGWNRLGAQVEVACPALRAGRLSLKRYDALARPAQRYW